MYFPKSQIKPNLYTNGGEFILSTNKQPYSGYYYEISNGNKYTGKTPEDGINILLSTTINLLNLSEPSKQSDINFGHNILLYTTPSSDIYSFQHIERSLPSISITQPTIPDQQLGIFNRYFCKKNNELIYMEISKETYTQLKLNDPKIAWDLYSGQLLLWQIAGTKEQVYKANKSNVDIIETQQKWHGFSQYFKDKYLKYYLEP